MSPVELGSGAPATSRKGSSTATVTLVVQLKLVLLVC